MQAQINRVETAHARVAKRITEDLDWRTSSLIPVAKPNIKYVLPEFNGERSLLEKYLSRMTSLIWKHSSRNSNNDIGMNTFNM